METESKIEAENSCEKNEVKVTNLVSEIKTTDLPRESPIQVDRKEEGDTNSNEEGKIIKGDKKIAEDNDNVVKEDNGDEKVDHEKMKAEEVEKVDNENKKTDESKRADNKDKKADESKKVDNSDKKTDESKNGVNEDKKTNDSKKVEKGEKKAEDSKKADNGDKKEDGSNKVEKEGKKVEESKKVGKKSDDDKKLDMTENKSLGKSSKQEKVSPLAAYFKDWDKFTIYQKIDIERLIIKKAEEMGAPARTKPGVRTYDEKDRMRFRWSAIRRRNRRQSRRFKESLGLEGSRDRRSPIRHRESGDMRSRYPGDNRRYGYSPRGEASWRSPWSSPALPVENLIKQMERFVQMVDKFPKPITRPVPGNMIYEEPKMPLLPTPPHGYNFALRGNNSPTENKARDYMGNNYGPPQSRWSVQQFTVNAEEPSRRLLGKEPSSKSLPKPRPSPYNNRSSYPSTTQRKDNWPSRDRGYSKNSGIQPPSPYKESRFHYGTPYRR